MVKLNRRVKVWVFGSIKNDQGGIDPVDIDSWEKWADVDQPGGNNNNPYQQQVWNKDFRVQMRYEKTRPTKSNYEIEYRGQRMKIENINIENEGYMAYEVLRCSVMAVPYLTVNESS